MPGPAAELIRVPMRDGIRLITELVLPQDRDPPYPLILIRTPYPRAAIPYESRPIALFQRSGYAVATQACRGTGGSEGEASFLRAEGEDGYDAIEWFAQQPWCNGRIGMYGSSYLASAQWLAAKQMPPHLCAIAPQSPGAMFFYEAPLIGGALCKAQLLAWPKVVDVGTWDTDPQSWEQALRASPNAQVVRDWHGEGAMGQSFLQTLEHPTLDTWWEEIMLTPAAAARIDIPVFCITGFHDGDQAGALYNWALMERFNAGSRASRHLLVGPWRHAQMATGQAQLMGEMRFAPDASVNLPDLIRDFFDVYLKGDASKRDRLPARCRLYTSGPGDGRGRWHETPEYECATPTPLFLHGPGSSGPALRWLPPERSAEHTAFVTDWRDPVPSVAVGEDARPILGHPQVRIFSSDALSEPLTVLGAVTARLWMSADAPDFDVILRILEQRPDGRLINLTGELGCAPFRARYRLGFDRQVPHSGLPECLDFHVCHLGHRFGAGSRVVVALCGTADGLIEPNHHTGEDILTAAVRRPARQCIHHDAEFPSAIRLPLFQPAGDRHTHGDLQ